MDMDFKRPRKYVVKRCVYEGCSNGARSKGLCKRHGGGRRCQIESCNASDQGGGFCISHGGGRRCKYTGCKNGVQSRGFCKAHGGGRRCTVDGCTKSSQSEGLCRIHGGGKRCIEQGCVCTGAIVRRGYCKTHYEQHNHDSVHYNLCKVMANRTSVNEESFQDTASTLIEIFDFELIADDLLLNMKEFPLYSEQVLEKEDIKRFFPNEVYPTIDKGIDSTITKQLEQEFLHILDGVIYSGPVGYQYLI